MEQVAIGKRVAAFVFDMGLVMTIVTAVILVRTLVGYQERQPMSQGDETFAMFAMLVVPWLYFTILETSGIQASVGKKLAGCKVVGVDGKSLSVLAASCRFFALVLPVLLPTFLPDKTQYVLAGVMFSFLLFGHNHLPLQDVVTKSRVVARDLR